MKIVRFRSTSEAKEMLRKVKKMYQFTKELKECLEEKLEGDDFEDDEEDDDEAEYRMDGETRGYRGARYRRGMK